MNILKPQRSRYPGCGNRLLLANDSLFSSWGNDSCPHLILQSPGNCPRHMPRPGSCRYPSARGCSRYHPRTRPYPLFRAVGLVGRSSLPIPLVSLEHTGCGGIQALPLRFPTSAITSILPCSVPAQVLQQNLSCFFVLLTDESEPKEETAECVFLVVHRLVL